jgi:hypothetical protein
MPLFALALTLVSGVFMEGDWLEEGHLQATVYSLHLTGWLLLSLSLVAHLAGLLRRGGWPLAGSIVSLAVRPGDGPTAWPAQLWTYLRRSRR